MSATGSAPAVLVTTTVDSEAAALALAEAVVTERLAACAQVSQPVTSFYRWQEKLERSTEWVCHIKAAPVRLPELMDRIRALHPYQVPEILAVEVDDGDPAYLEWVAGSVKPS